MRLSSPKLFLAALPFLLAILFTTAYCSAVVSPEYSAHDTGMLQAFLRQCDDTGESNAAKLQWDIENPATWDGAVWTEPATGPRRLAYLTIYAFLPGKLELSDLPELRELNCASNRLSELRLSNLPKLIKLDCYYNFLPILSFAPSTN